MAKRGRGGRALTPGEKKDRLQRIIGVGLIVAVVAVVVLFFVYQFRNPPLQIDAETNCPKSGPVSYAAVVLDSTDRINAIVKKAIENEFSRIQDRIPKFGALAIYSAGFEGEIVRPDFFLCNPGDTSEMNWLTEGKTLVERKWNLGFQEPLGRVLQEMLSGSEADQTPLLEAIQSVSVQSFGPLVSQGDGEIPKNLIIFSDMIQNSENLNLYNGVPTWQQFLSTEAYRKIRSDLRDVEVSIFFVRRQTRNSIQGPELIRFWEGLISGQGGRLVHFKPLEG